MADDPTPSPPSQAAEPSSASVHVPGAMGVPAPSVQFGHGAGAATRTPASTMLRRLVQRIRQSFGEYPALTADQFDQAYKHARGYAGGTASGAARKKPTPDADADTMPMATTEWPTVAPVDGAPDVPATEGTALAPCAACMAGNPDQCACPVCADGDPVGCLCAPHLELLPGPPEGDPVAFAEEQRTPWLTEGDAAFRLFIEMPERGSLTFTDVTEWIPYLPKPGNFSHPAYGKMAFNAGRNREFVENFNRGVYQHVLPLDAEHQTKLSGACAWITRMRLNEDGSADALVEWTDRGRALMADKRFRFVSPEFYDSWTDPATQKEYKNVAIGGALTVRPYFKEGSLRPLVASEAGISLVGLDPSVPVLLSPEAGDQQTPPPTGQETRTMAEPITITPAEVPMAMSEAELTRKFAEMETARQAAEQKATQAIERVAALEADKRRQQFRELAKDWAGSTDEHVTMLEGLTDDQRAIYSRQHRAYAELLDKSDLMKEIGVRGEEAGSNANGVKALIESRIKEWRAATPGMSYEAAYSKTLTEDPKLYDQYLRDQAAA